MQKGIWRQYFFLFYIEPTNAEPTERFLNLLIRPVAFMAQRGMPTTTLGSEEVISPSLHCCKLHLVTYIGLRWFIVDRYAALASL